MILRISRKGERRHITVIAVCRTIATSIYSYNGGIMEEVKMKVTFET